MKLNTLFTITAVVMIFFGVGFILLPAMVFSMYGVTLDANGIMLAHVAGAAVFALGLLAGLFRKSRTNLMKRFDPLSCSRSVLRTSTPMFKAWTARPSSRSGSAAA